MLDGEARLGVAVLVDQFMNPKLADNFFGLRRAVLVRGETLQVGLAVFLDQPGFNDFEVRQVEE